MTQPSTWGAPCHDQRHDGIGVASAGLIGAGAVVDAGAMIIAMVDGSLVELAIAIAATIFGWFAFSVL